MSSRCPYCQEQSDDLSIAMCHDPNWVSHPMCLDCSSVMSLANDVVGILGARNAARMAHLLAHWCDNCDPPELVPDSARPAVDEQAN